MTSFVLKSMLNADQFYKQEEMVEHPNFHNLHILLKLEMHSRAQCIARLVP